MKTKLFLTATILALAFKVNAQTEKGQNAIGGVIFFSNNHSDVTNNSSEYENYTISINYGYFVSKNLSLGINGGFERNKSESSYDANIAVGGNYILTKITATSNFRSFNVGPYVRHYVDIVNKFKFYNQFSAEWGFGKQKNQNYNAANSFDVKSYAASINSGFAFFPTKKIALELGLNLLSYTKSTLEDDISGIKETSKNFNFGLNTLTPSLGVNFHF